MKAGAGEPYPSGKHKYAPEWLIVGPDQGREVVPYGKGGLGVRRVEGVAL